MAASAPPASATRRRRWPRILTGALVALAVVLLVLLAAATWYLSGLIGAGSAVPQPDAGYPMTVTAIDGDWISYSGVAPGWDDEGLAAVEAPDGTYVQLGHPEDVTDGSGRRMAFNGFPDGALEVGTRLRLDGWFFGRDPRAVLGIDFEEVGVPTELGAAPAWLVPGTSSTWVVYAHGRGDGPAQGLRLVHALRDRGYPMLLISYRNDPGAPAGDGYAHWGADEWRDLEAAVQYALDNGAQRIVLAGTSMGGAMALSLLEQSSVADAVVAVVLDAPAVDFGATVDAQAADMGVPPPITALAKAVAEWRFGIDWSAVDHVHHASELAVPVLVLTGEDDTSARLVDIEAYAAAAPEGLVDVIAVPRAGHTTAWNLFPEVYEPAVVEFLDGAAPPS